MMTVEMVGRRRSQFRATCGTLFSVSLATCSRASTTLYKCSAAPNLSRQTAPPERTPDRGPNSLIKTEGHQFPFVLSSDQRIIDLVSHVTRPAIAVGSGKRLHHVPAGKIGTGYVPYLTAFDQLVKRAQNFFDGSERVESMKMVNIDVVGA